MLIEKYQISYAGHDTIAVHGEVTEDDIALISSLKERILRHVRFRANLQSLHFQDDTQRLLLIPGLKDICCASAAERTDLCQRYPDAVFVLRMAAGRKDPDFELASICARTYRSILSGVDIQSAKLRYEKECELYLKKIMWA